ncbi:hypothetical protein [Bradyrhizobium cosmicum]|jgi:hypothetical protein|uniref:Uncharacterized protein n=1 Tax=Bradyrhizobium cosmicum TaxID=1404864 RepID=A0AAI8M8B0_9BRAD|nr:hypothetical protein [Bradyrhizobium cosmicum]BAL73515.1 hypothetical protein S23_02920 [Bradyrhizobium cosmicum]
MSNSDHAPDKPPALPRQEPPQRSGCLTALMAISGVILLLPGLCALLFGGLSISDRSQIASDIAPLIFLGLAVGAGGVGLIWAAIRRRRS